MDAQHSRALRLAQSKQHNPLATISPTDNMNNFPYPSRHAAETGSLRRLQTDPKTIAERFDINAMIDQTRQAQSPVQLISARRDLIYQIGNALDDPRVQDWTLVTTLNEKQQNLQHRSDDRTGQLNDGPIYQPKLRLAQARQFPPLWRDTNLPNAERERLQRARVRCHAARDSEAKRMLTQKLKSGARHDFEYLRRLQAVESGIRDERQQMRANLQALNEELSQAEAYDSEGGGVLEAPEPSMDDLIERELAQRGGKAKRFARPSLRRRNSQGMLSILKIKADRYDDERVLPWTDEPGRKESWRERVAAIKRPALRRKLSQLSCKTIETETETEKDTESVCSIASSISTISSMSTVSSDSLHFGDFPVPPKPSLNRRLSQRVFVAAKKGVKIVVNRKLPAIVEEPRFAID